MSATAEWFLATISLGLVVLLALVESEEYWGNVKKLVKGEDEEEDELPASAKSGRSLILLLASRVWRSCSSSLTKLIAPPTMDA